MFNLREIKDMQEFNLSEGGHEWEKTNLVTIEGKRPYDIYKCKRCGITGKSYRLGTIEIPERSILKWEHVKSCKDMTLSRLLVVTLVVKNL